jgi:methylaspartate mutase epsilon subunit
MHKCAIPIDEFHKLRREVLGAWPTGAAVDLEEAFRYQHALPETKRFAVTMHNAKANRRLLLQPRAGVALIGEHIKLLKYLETEGEADLLPTTIDAYTRQNRYADAAKGIEKSETSGVSMLNGFPAVNYGVKNCRVVTEGLARPVQVRHGTPDARLLAEITLAGGFTSSRAAAFPTTFPTPRKCRSSNR